MGNVGVRGPCGIYLYFPDLIVIFLFTVPEWLKRS